MQKLAFLSAIFALAVSWSDRAAAEIVMFYPTVHAEPLPADAVGVERTAAIDAYLIRQVVVHHRLARLQEPLSVVDGPRTFTVGPNNLMYSVNARNRAVPAFCTYDITYVGGRNVIGVIGRFPTCFLDVDRDGAFDRMFASFGGSFNLLIGDWGQDLPPTPYTVVDDDPPRALEVGLRFVRRGFGRNNGRLEAVHIRPNGEAIPLANGRADIPRELPATVVVSGAEIEVRSVADGVITYVVRSGFSSDPVEVELPDPTR